MPTKPGVYVFKDQQGKILYVGKAKNLKNRVKSYFQSDIRLSPKTAQLVSRIHTIEYIEVNSEIEALLLESKLIKKFQPHYNIASKDDKSPFYIHITIEKFPKPIINHEPKKAISGPFLSRFTARQILKSFRRITPYHTETPCFYSHLGLCNPCPIQYPEKIGEYRKNISRLKKLLSGYFKPVLNELKSTMAVFSKSHDFENAALIRDQIKNLEYLLSKPVSADEYIVNPNLVEDQRQAAINSLKGVPFLKGDPFHRIEMFDNAHLSGTSPTSAMTVAMDGELDSKHYRHFTLHTSNDVDMMSEVLLRRLKRKDWPLPDLIVLDGGKPQLSIVNWSIPTIALAKKDEIIYTTTNQQIKLPKDHPGLKLLMQLRDEAHRFSRRLHHKHRRIIIK